MAAGPLRAVVTGGSKGIGLHLALEIARRPEAQVVFGGRSPLESLPSATRALIDGLPPGRARYYPVDVTSNDSLSLFREAVAGFLRVTSSSRFVVIANAGQAALDKDTDRVAAMRRTNIDGTSTFFSMFQWLLGIDGGTFIPLSSIEATRGIVIPGRRGHFDTKVFTRDYARRTHAALMDSDYPITAWALAPGVVRTDMTEEGPLFCSLGLAVAKRAPTDPALRAGLETYFCVSADNFNNVTFVLGAMFGETSEGRALSSARRLLAGDPSASKNKTRLMVFRALSEGAVLARVAGLLVALDIAMAPEVFARRVVDFIESGEYPPNGVLEVFSAHEGDPSKAPILSYLSAFAAAAPEGSG